jgi:O-antigen/teichoic acid export membrane protein
VESLSDVIYGAMQLHEEMRTQSISLCLKGALSFVFMALGLHYFQTVTGAAAGITVAWTILFISYDVPAITALLRTRDTNARVRKKPIRLERESRPLKALFKEALPLGIVMLLLSLNVNIPRYFLKASAGSSGLGIFAALSYVMVAGTTVITALGQAAAPRLARQFQFGDVTSFVKLLYRLLAMGAALGVAGIIGAALLGRPILTILYKAEYAKHLREFVLIAIASCLTYIASFLGYGMTAALRYSSQLYAIGLSTITLTLSCWFLIPLYGLTGAASSAVLSSLVLTVASATIVHSAIAERTAAPVEGLPVCVTRVLPT